MVISGTIQDIPDWTEAIRIAFVQIFSERYSAKHNITSPKKPANFQDASAIIGRALEILLISKNQKYGKDNILNSTDFGVEPKKGVALRMNDKFERLKNGLQGMDLGKEGFVDSFGDLIGYSAVGLMLELGWYELPIVGEKK